MLSALLSCSAAPRHEAASDDALPEQVDRFEGERTVLVRGRSQRTVPRRALVPSLREGDVVPANRTAEAARRALEQTEALRARVRAAREQAGGTSGSFSLEEPPPLGLTLSGQR